MDGACGSKQILDGFRTDRYMLYSDHWNVLQSRSVEINLRVQRGSRQQKELTINLTRFQQTALSKTCLSSGDVSAEYSLRVLITIFPLVTVAPLGNGRPIPQTPAQYNSQ